MISTGFGPLAIRSSSKRSLHIGHCNAHSHSTLETQCTARKSQIPVNKFVTATWWFLVPLILSSAVKSVNKNGHLKRATVQSTFCLHTAQLRTLLSQVSIHFVWYTCPHFKTLGKRWCLYFHFQNYDRMDSSEMILIDGVLPWGRY